MLLGQQVLPVLQVLLEKPDHKEIQEQRVLKVLLVIQAQRGQRVTRETKDQLVRQEPLVLLAIRVQKGIPVTKALKEIQALLERQALREPRALQEQPEQPAKLAQPVPQDRKATLATLAHKAQQGTLVPLDQKETQEIKDRKVLLVRPVPPAKPEQLGLLEQRALRERLGPQVIQVLRGLSRYMHRLLTGRLGRQHWP